MDTNDHGNDNEIGATLVNTVVDDNVLDTHSGTSIPKPY